MAVPVSLRNMPDHIWSKKDETVDSKNGPSYGILQFPQTKIVLWDSSPQGSVVQLHVASYRKPYVCVSEKLLRLLQKQCENQPQQSLSTILLGSLAIDDDGEGVMFHVDRLDTRTNADNSLTVAPEDVTIPFQVYINGSKERNANVKEFTDTLRSLESRCYSKEIIEVGGFMLTRGWCNFYTGAEHCVAHIDLNLVILSTQFNAIPISPVPIVPTALSKNLAGPLSFSHLQGIPKTGYLTMDHTRKLLLVLESDPKALSLPVVGIWISGAPVVHHPFVWCACLRYIHNAHLQDRVCSPPDNFLVVLYSPLHSKPEFYECETKNGKSELDFDLYTGYDAFNISKNSRSTNCGVIKIDLNCVKVGPKSEVFDAALNVFGKKSCTQGEMKSSCKVSGVDDMEPRLTPAPLIARTPMIQNLVPDVSFVNDLPSANHSRSKVKQPLTAFTNNDHTKSHWSATYQPRDVYHDTVRTKPINSVLSQSVPCVASLPPQAVVPNNSSNQSSPVQMYQPVCNNYQPLITTPNIISKNCDVPTMCQNNDIPHMNNGLTHSQPYEQQNPTSQTRQSNGHIHAPQYVPNYSNRCSLVGQKQLKSNPSTERYPQQSLPTQPTSYKYYSLPSQGPPQIQQVQKINEFFAPQTVCSSLPVYSKPNSAFHHILNQGMNPNCKQILQQQPQPPSKNSQNINSCRQPLHNDITEQSSSHTQADSTCSGKSSDDSGLSVTPDRLNPSPKEGSPGEKERNYSRPFSLEFLNKEQCSPEVYNLLMQQNAQLQQLQSQIQLLLQKQQDSTTRSQNSTEISSTSESSDSSNSAMKSICQDEIPKICTDTNSKKMVVDEGLEETSKNCSIPLDSISVQPLNTTNVCNETQRTDNDIKRDGSDNYNSGQTPVEIRHNGVLVLNSTQREDSENMEQSREDLITVMNNIGLHEQITGSHIDASSPRSNDGCNNSNMSSNRFPTQLTDESGSFGQEGGSENPQYYENLIANIRQFLDSHEDTTNDEDMMFSDQTSKCTSDKLDDNPSLENNKCTKSEHCVDTTIIPKISYMSMMFDSDSDTSVEISAMAMKYLKDEQLTQLMKLQHHALNKDKNSQKNSLLRQLLHSEHNGIPDISQNGFSVNDMTFATRNYMEKHGLLENSASIPDKSIDFEFQMKTDYSISSNEVSSPLRTFTNPRMDAKNPEDAYARIRLLKSPVKKEILYPEATEDMFSPQMYRIPTSSLSTKCYQPSVSSSINDQHLQSSNSSPVSDGGSMCHQLNKGYRKHLYNPYNTNNPSINQNDDDDDDRILDIVKLKQMPKLL